MALSPLFHPLNFDDLPGWNADRHSRAYEAFMRSAARAREKPYKSGTLGVSFGSGETVLGVALSAGPLDDDRARRFFEVHFVPCAIRTGDGERGFATGYYEPVVEASPVQTALFRYPLLRVPPDLVKVHQGNRPPDMDPYFAFGRKGPAGISEYHDRQAIERGALNGLELEIAWLADLVDLFFIHVQGCARLLLPGGRVLRVTYAAKTGHRFTGPGGVLTALGEIPRDRVTMQSIREWFRRNPGRVNEILWQNRSYIFFREAPVDDPRLGPVAAAKVPLTPGRSIAVDRLLHTFGTPFFIDAPDLELIDGAPLRRLMIAQDTGSAITGPARADIFVGSGDEAGQVAGVIRHHADFYALLPRALVGS
jgi:membrane-bound lytic murein transglycosylase A